MNKLTQAEISSLRVKTLHGEVSKESFNTFVAGFNDASRLIGYEYNNETGEIEETSVKSFSIQTVKDHVDVNDALAIAYYKRGFLKAMSAIRKMDKLTDDLYLLERQIAQY